MKPKSIPPFALMKPTILLCLALVLSGILLGCSTAKNSFKSTDSLNKDADKDLTKQIANILTECEKIKPGMTRADLLKVFTTEGGLSTATHRTFVCRSCPKNQIRNLFKPGLIDRFPP
jgi:hypothetical protein